METKQTAKKSKPNAILAKTRVGGKLQGEGDYEAARRYDSDARKFVRRTEIGRAAGVATPKRERGPGSGPMRMQLAARVNHPRPAGSSLTWKAFAAVHERNSRPARSPTIIKGTSSRRWNS